MQGDFFREKTVLVSGATGFLGGWLVRRLLERGANVVALVRSSKSESQFYLQSMDSITTVEWGDVSDESVIEDVFRRHAIDVFFHTASVSDVNRVLEQPLECFRAAAVSTWQILDYIRRKQYPCISVISSTDKVYGRQPLPYREHLPLQPLHPYETAKATQDLCAQSYGKVFGCAVAVTRCGNYFGGYDFNFDRLIPGVVRSITSGQAPILRSNGQFTRDFLYIEDAVDVQLMLAERLASQPALYGEPFNFSYGDQIKVIDVVERICTLLNLGSGPTILDVANTEIQQMQLCSNKAREILEWKPKWGFNEGLDRTVRWYRDYFDGATDLALGN